MQTGASERPQTFALWSRLHIIILKMILVLTQSFSLRSEAEGVDLPSLVAADWLVPSPEDDLWSNADAASDIKKLVELHIDDPVHR